MIVSLVSLLTTVSSLPSILYNKKEYYYHRKCLHCVKHVRNENPTQVRIRNNVIIKYFYFGNILIYLLNIKINIKHNRLSYLLSVYFTLNLNYNTVCILSETLGCSCCLPCTKLSRPGSQTLLILFFFLSSTD